MELATVESIRQALFKYKVIFPRGIAIYDVAELLFPKLPIRRPAWQSEPLAAG